MDVALAASRAGRLVLACALKQEERVARRVGARTALVGLGATLPLPEGDLVSFGVAGGLAPGLTAGDLVTAYRVVDPEGNVLWEGEPLRVAGAEPAVVCAVEAVADEPDERAALARSSGATVADMESGRLAATGRLAGVVRAISDTGGEPVGRLVRAGRADGSTDWHVVAAAVLLEPVQTARTARSARRAFAALETAAAELAGPVK